MQSAIVYLQCCSLSSFMRENNFSDNWVTSLETAASPPARDIRTANLEWAGCPQLLMALGTMKGVQ